MSRNTPLKFIPKEQIRQGLALALLLVIAALAIAGPTGLLAWNDNAKLLEQREAQILALSEKKNELRNRVELLDMESADPDLVGELLRENLNVVHPDEVVITLDEE